MHSANMVCKHQNSLLQPLFLKLHGIECRHTNINIHIFFTTMSCPSQSWLCRRVFASAAGSRVPQVPQAASLEQLTKRYKRGVRTLRTTGRALHMFDSLLERFQSDMPRQTSIFLLCPLRKQTLMVAADLQHLLLPGMRVPLGCRPMAATLGCTRTAAPTAPSSSFPLRLNRTDLLIARALNLPRRAQLQPYSHLQLGKPASPCLCFLKPK